MAKAEPKDSQVPVTAATPQPYSFAPIPTVELPGTYPVLDILGSFLMWADEHTARKLLAERKVQILRHKKGKGKIIGLMVIPDPDMPADQIVSQKKFFGLPHRRETEDNPAKVWTQDKMGSTRVVPKPGSVFGGKSVPNARARWCRKVCKQVVLDCLAKPALKRAA